MKRKRAVSRKRAEIPLSIDFARGVGLRIRSAEHRASGVKAFGGECKLEEGREDQKPTKGKERGANSEQTGR